MKNQQIDEKTSQQTEICSDRKRPRLWLLVLCLLFGIGVLISLPLLGECLARFIKEESYVISLVPPKESSSETQDEGTQDEGTPDLSIPGTEQTLSEQGTPAPGETLSRQTYGNTSYTPAQPDEHHGELLVNDDVQIWNSETRVDLFKNNYDGTAQSGDAEKIIAPGTSNFYDFTLKNNGDIPLDYTISLQMETYLGEQAADSEIPLEWRLVSGDGDVVSEWQRYHERAEVLKQAKLNVRRQDNYTVEWRWDFERGGEADAEDTMLGNLSVDQLLDVKAVIYVSAQQSADWDGKLPGPLGIPLTGDTSDIALFTVMLIASACVLFLFFAADRYRNKVEDMQNDRK